MPPKPPQNGYVPCWIDPAGPDKRDYIVGERPACKRAVDDFRAKYGLTEEIRPIDREAVFWQRDR
jgi:Macrocin-O-methyltransferase (TylF)